MIFQSRWCYAGRAGNWIFDLSEILSLILADTDCRERDGVSPSWDGIQEDGHDIKAYVWEHFSLHREQFKYSNILILWQLDWLNSETTAFFYQPCR